MTLSTYRLEDPQEAHDLSSEKFWPRYLIVEVLGD
jgi:hypothetical protein